MLQGDKNIKNEHISQAIVTPVGVAKFPRLNTPDTKFDSDGVFSVDLVLDEKATEELKKDLELFEKSAVDHMKAVKGVDKVSLSSNLLKKDVDAEGNETGNYVIRAKAKAKFVPSIPVFDANNGGERTEEVVTMGSKIAVNGTLASYTAAGRFGVTLRLNGVLLVELGTMHNSNKAANMFGKSLINSTKNIKPGF